MLGLSVADIVEMVPFCIVQLRISYPLLAAVEHYLRQEEIRTGEKEYAEDVMIPLLLREEEAAAVCEELTNLTAGTGKLQRAGIQVVAVPVA